MFFVPRSALSFGPRIIRDDKSDSTEAVLVRKLFFCLLTTRHASTFTRISIEYCNPCILKIFCTKLLSNGRDTRCCGAANLVNYARISDAPESRAAPLTPRAAPTEGPSSCSGVMESGHFLRSFDLGQGGWTNTKFIISSDRGNIRDTLYIRGSIVYVYTKHERAQFPSEIASSSTDLAAGVALVLH